MAATWRNKGDDILVGPFLQRTTGGLVRPLWLALGLVPDLRIAEIGPGFRDEPFGLTPGALAEARESAGEKETCVSCQPLAMV